MNWRRVIGGRVRGIVNGFRFVLIYQLDAFKNSCFFIGCSVVFLEQRLGPTMNELNHLIRNVMSLNFYGFIF